jgi:hypothetical protein
MPWQHLVISKARPLELTSDAAGLPEATERGEPAKSAKLGRRHLSALHALGQGTGMAHHALNRCDEGKCTRDLRSREALVSLGVMLGRPLMLLRTLRAWHIHAWHAQEDMCIGKRPSGRAASAHWLLGLGEAPSVLPSKGGGGTCTLSPGAMARILCFTCCWCCTARRCSQVMQRLTRCLASLLCCAGNNASALRQAADKALHTITAGRFLQ